MNRFSKRLLLASAMLSGAMLSAPAHAQAANDVDEVIVTGSRIKRVDISGVGPATVVSQEEISNTGITNVETLLQRLPASAGAAGGQTSAYWTGNGYGTAQVNLRGLGINRTLTLINGRRVVNGGTGANSAPDLNMIPTAIIGRMDILKDGASAIYGAAMRPAPAPADGDGQGGAEALRVPMADPARDRATDRDRLRASSAR